MNVQPGTPLPPPAPAAAGDQETPRSAPPARAGLDGPLLGDPAGWHARWQQAQAQFVEDPREALGDAADLIEQTAQAMIGTLRQRQRELRLLWDRGPAGPAGSSGPAEDEPTIPDGEPVPATSGQSDTERLRLVMQRYRALFSELCGP